MHHSASLRKTRTLERESGAPLRRKILSGPPSALSPELILNQTAMPLWAETSNHHERNVLAELEVVVHGLLELHNKDFAASRFRLKHILHTHEN